MPRRPAAPTSSPWQLGQHVRYRALAQVATDASGRRRIESVPARGEGILVGTTRRSEGELVRGGLTGTRLRVARQVLLYEVKSELGGPRLLVPPEGLCPPAGGRTLGWLLLAMLLLGLAARLWL